MFYTFGDGKARNRMPAEFTPAKSITGVATKRAQQGEFAPQLTITYFWEIVDSTGATLRTDPQQMVYGDDRFKWQKVSNDRATVFWYDGGAQFGPQVLEWTVQGLDRLESKFGIKMSYPTNVVVYKTKEDMSGALAPRGETFERGATILGEARSTYGTTLVLNQGDLRTTLWHELSHLVLHDLVKGPYESNIPAWLDEGLAMYNESDNSNDNYKRALDDAIRRNDVFTVRAMTSPNGVPSKVGIWYGQARSVVQYLVESDGGKDKMKQFIDLLASGTRTDPALQQVYGFDQDGLNTRWRQSVKLPVDNAPAQGSQPAPNTQPAPGPQPVPDAPPAQPGQAAQPAPPAPAQPAQPAPATGIPSRTGLLVLAALGLVAVCSTLLLALAGVVAAVFALRRA